MVLRGMMARFQFADWKHWKKIGWYCFLFLFLFFFILRMNQPLERKSWECTKRMRGMTEIIWTVWENWMWCVFYFLPLPETKTTSNVLCIPYFTFSLFLKTGSLFYHLNLPFPPIPFCTLLCLKTPPLTRLLPCPLCQSIHSFSPKSQIGSSSPHYLRILLTPDLPHLKTISSLIIRFAHPPSTLTLAKATHSPETRLQAYHIQPHIAVYLDLHTT